jgi:hypothetical protein
MMMMGQDFVMDNIIVEIVDIMDPEGYYFFDV